MVCRAAPRRAASGFTKRSSQGGAYRWGARFPAATHKCVSKCDPKCPAAGQKIPLVAPDDNLYHQQKQSLQLPGQQQALASRPPIGAVPLSPTLHLSSLPWACSWAQQRCPMWGCLGRATPKHHPGSLEAKYQENPHRGDLDAYCDFLKHLHHLKKVLLVPRLWVTPFVEPHLGASSALCSGLCRTLHHHGGTSWHHGGREEKPLLPSGIFLGTLFDPNSMIFEIPEN